MVLKAVRFKKRSAKKKDRNEQILPEQECIRFLPYCAGIPWKFLVLKGHHPIFKTYKVCKQIDIRFWNKYVKRKIMSKTLICGGGALFETLICITLASQVLHDNHIEIDDWLVPRYCYDLLDALKIKYKQKVDKSKSLVGYSYLIDDIKKLTKITKNHSVPIFYHNKDVYFNMLLDYGLYNASRDANENPFYCQILDNLCLKYSKYVPAELDKEQFLKIVNDYMRQYIGNNNLGKYFLINNSSTVLLRDVKRTVAINYILSNKELQRISYALLKNGIKCIVLTNSKLSYVDPNIINIPPWINIPSHIMCGLLLNSVGILSSDSQMYLSAALLRVPNIICTERQSAGFSFEDIKGLLRVKNMYNWVEDSSYDFERILNNFDKMLLR